MKKITALSALLSVGIFMGCEMPFGGSSKSARVDFNSGPYELSSQGSRDTVINGATYSFQRFMLSGLKDLGVPSDSLHTFVSCTKDVYLGRATHHSDTTIIYGDSLKFTSALLHQHDNLASFDVISPKDSAFTAFTAHIVCGE